MDLWRLIFGKPAEPQPTGKPRHRLGDFKVPENVRVTGFQDWLPDASEPPRQMLDVIEIPEE